MLRRVQKSEETCVQKDDLWNPSTCTFENCKYLKNITGDSVIFQQKLL